MGLLVCLRQRCLDGHCCKTVTTEGGSVVLVGRCSVLYNLTQGTTVEILSIGSALLVNLVEWKVCSASKCREHLRWDGECMAVAGSNTLSASESSLLRNL